MQLKTLAALALSMAGTAHAGIYVVGHTVQPCAEKAVQQGYDKVFECRIPTTQKRVNVKYKDEYGTVKVANIVGWYQTKCDTDGTCVVYGSPDYPRDAYVGDSVKGIYRVTYGWYLWTDANGKATAYLNGYGPKHNGPAYDPSEGDVTPDTLPSDDSVPVAPGSDRWEE